MCDKVIILAEDDEKWREMLSFFLSTAAKNAGFNLHILEAKNGEEALRLFVQHKSELSGVWTDNQMPLLTGVELVNRIKKEVKASIVLFTADSGLPCWEGDDIKVYSKTKRREAVAWFIERL